MREMISTTEAKKIIDEATSVLSPVSLPIKEAAGLVLATSVIAAYDIPAFPQSSMDGYAISYNDWKSSTTLQISGEISAGASTAYTLTTGRAVRIFTGAAVPNGADTVVMQEKVKIGLSDESRKELIIEDEKLQAGNNVRQQGSEIRAGEIALPENTWLSAAAIGFLAGVGIDRVNVFPNPVIDIIITGNELQQPGNTLVYGEVFESNSFALAAALNQLGITSVHCNQVGDDPIQIQQALQTALHRSDLILLTGGVSVGDYDFVSAAARDCGVKTLFHRIRQRPGKPIYAGKWKDKLVFGLPGNPSSVLTCFYEYVIPAIEKMTGRPIGLRRIKTPLSKPFQKMSGLTHFIKGLYNGDTVTPLNAQESYRMSSFARANCLIQIDEAVTQCDEGELVEIHLFSA